ncbi:olfactory receptor 5V1-like [Rhinatrema bivittatum]|uniref:olfactory receptor 5V1-like n=1 Tax=Rhinatrema bivittatum TaxID=194408 RepID=UPI00112B5CC0|nr:olfactory receptor 5V1-like [Rhinatrema bivittatum]
MEKRNQTNEVTFILLGFSDIPEHQTSLFVVFFFMYVITLIGNLLIILTIRVNPQLHIPMYFFLGNLSLVDICFITSTIPKLLIHLLSQNKTISFSDCLGQVFFMFSTGSTEFFLLAVMAYDRYVAICNPLRYTIVMKKRVCVVLVVISWITASLTSLLHTLMASRLSFHGSNTIQHFFCDLPPLLRLSCSDTSVNEILIFTDGPFVVMAPFLFTVVSYVHIISTILKIPSAMGRRKAFSTCSSHLIVVSLFYGTDIFVYFRPDSNFSFNYDRVVSVMYTVVTPMLNPFIYSLRNNEVKGALKKVIASKLFTQ